MSNLKFFSYILKFLGMTESESKLVVSRNCEYNFIYTTDTKMMQSERYAGLSDMDKTLARSFNKDYGHLNNGNSRIKY